MPDLPDYWTQAAMAWSLISGIVGGLDASKSAAPAVKDVYLATDTNKLYVCYTAGAWTDVTHACLLLAGGTMTGNIAMGGNKVTGLGAPTAANDAARKAYVDLFTLLTTFNDHSARHENAGADEISVAGLSGLLADDQHVLDAEAKAAAVQAGAITNGVTKAPTHDAVYDVKVTADAALPAGDKYTDAEAVDAIEADANLPVAGINFIMDGGGSVLAGGLHGLLEVPFACTINRVTLISVLQGSVVINIWKGTYAEWPFGTEKSIIALAPPTIDDAKKYQDSTLTDWTIAIAAGDLLAFEVTSVTTIDWLLIALKVTKT